MPNDPRILQSTPADIFPGGETPQLPAIIIGMPVGNAQAGLPLIVDSSSRLMQSSTLGTGTVTSVALAAPAEITVAGSPITGAGTFTMTWTNQTQNKVFASPNGSTGTPAFRALVNADLPTSGVAAATYGDATHVGQFTVNAQGIITSASNVAISAGSSITYSLQILTFLGYLMVASTTIIYLIQSRNVSGAIQNIQLPDPATHTQPIYIEVGDVGAGGTSNNLIRHAAEKIDGVAASITLANTYGAVGSISVLALYSDGTDWWSFNRVKF